MRWADGGAIVATVALALLVLSSALAVPGPGAGDTPRATIPVVVGGSVPLALPSSSAPAAITVAPAFSPSVGTRLLGPVPATTPMTVVVGLAPPNPTGLAAYVSSAYLSGSASYHHFLSPSEIRARFAPAPTTMAAAEAYFGSFGLRATVSPTGFLLEVGGPSGAMGQAFGTQFDRYLSPSGRSFVSHPTPATLPAGYGWTGAYGLGNATPILPASGAPSSTSVAVAGPAAACAASQLGLMPCDFHTAYSIAPVYGNGTNGTGTTIAVVDVYSAAEPQTTLAADFRQFASTFALPTGGLSFAYPVPTTANLNRSGANLDWGLEEALDIEWARAIAPGASIEMTFSPDAGPGLGLAIDWLVANDAVNVISLSWGEPFTGIFNAFSGPCTSACNASTDGSYAVMDPLFEAAAAEGISVLAATGDCGAADGTSGLAVNYPAADPFVTAVGGTVLQVTASGGWLAESGWSGNASGAVSPGCVNQGGSGGGFAPLPRPPWQLGVAPANGERATPDVAMDAGTPAVIVYGGAYKSVGGTSLGTPIWAGIAALADEFAHSRLGLLTPALYGLYASANYSLAFHDITSGNNGYPAGVGWDPVTGLGTPIVSDLLPLLSGAPSAALHGPSLDLYASPRYGRAPLTVSFALESATAVPVEGVNFGDGNASLGGTAFVHTYTTPGVYAAHGFAYDGSGNSSLSPPIAIVVGGGTALSVTFSASSTTVAAGGSVTFSLGASGGRAPYLYNLSFGDGTFQVNQSGPTVTHVFHLAGSFCSEAVVRDSADPVDGAASVRIGIAVGGAPAPSCGPSGVPIVLTANTTAQIRDAPAEFPSLFSSSGGVAPPSGLTNSVQYSANDTYVRACGCAIFPTSGQYTVTAWENDTVDDSASVTVNVTVAPPLLGTFSASTERGVAPLTVTFRAAVTGGDGANASTTGWAFGNGHGAVGSNVSETYAQPGEYLAIGALSDRGHGNASEAFLIDVVAPNATGTLGVTATISPAVAVASGTTVQFQGAVVAPNGTGTPLGIAWDLGEGFGAFGPEANQTYRYPLPSAFGNALPVGISVVDGAGTVELRENLTLPSFFAVEPGGFVPRRSTLALATQLSPTSGPVPLRVTASSVATGADVLGVSWSFGDGSTAAGALANHTYAVAGLFTLVATARDAFGHVVVDSTPVRTDPALSVGGGPVPVSGMAPLTVEFSAAASGGYGPPYTYQWTFSSGPGASGPSVNRTFGQAGTYSASVNVTDRGGGTARRNWTVTVAAPAVPASLVILGGGAAVGVGSALFAVGRVRRKRRTPAGGVSP